MAYEISPEEAHQAAHTLLRAGIYSFNQKDYKMAEITLVMSAGLFSDVKDDWNESIANDWLESCRRKM